MLLLTYLKAGSRPKKATKVMKEMASTPMAIWEIIPIMAAGICIIKYQLPKWVVVVWYTTDPDHVFELMRYKAICKRYLGR